MKPRFTGLPFFVYPVTDMLRAREFHHGVLGLTETANLEDQFVEYDVGCCTLAISSLMQNALPAQAGCAALETDDFDGVIGYLKAKGVRFVMGPADTGSCHFARFLDSEGNHLALHRKHAGS